MLLHVVLLFLIGLNLIDSAGKAVFWSHNVQLPSDPKYSNMIDSNRLKSFLSECTSKVDAIVFVGIESEGIFNNQLFRNSFAVASSKQVMASQYTQEGKASLTSLKTLFLDIDVYQDSVNMQPTELKKTIQKQKKGDKTQFYRLDLKADENISSKFLDELVVDSTPNIMFVAIEEFQLGPSPKSAGNYHRLLSEDPTNDPNSKYYEPEGTEFSIYYAATYLYITPDIFTGLMTGLFVFFVLMIGLSCLSSIQGMNNFYDKTPAVGKEA